MKLDEYIKLHGRQGLNKSIGSNFLSQILTGKRKTGASVIAKIHKETGGLVTAKDLREDLYPPEIVVENDS